MNSESGICICTNEGYSPECPKAFYQGGRLLHSVELDPRPRPRIFPRERDGAVTPESMDEELEGVPPLAMRNLGERLSRPSVRVPPSRIDHSDKQLVSPRASLSSELETMLSGKCLESVQEREFRQDLIQSMSAEPSTNYGRFMTDSDMMRENRGSLRRFEALSVSGKTLTGLSIGGYEVDLSKAAQKASEVVPLPPSKLPIIFVDNELNFYHHFFQGLETLLGRAFINDIISSDTFFDDGTTEIITLIFDMLATGYEQTDNELTLLTKKVMKSTFDVKQLSGRDKNDMVLIVAANLWGFQYIECGMQCRESDLKMWLSRNYDFYKTLWFNAFKSAGVPSFALAGVQARQHIRSTQKALAYKDERIYADDKENERQHARHTHGNRTRRTNTIEGPRKHHRKQQGGVASFFLG